MAERLVLAAQALTAMWTTGDHLLRALGDLDPDQIDELDDSAAGTLTRDERKTLTDQDRATWRLTDEERKNVRDYYRHNPVQSPAIMTASVGGHRPR